MKISIKTTPPKSLYTVRLSNNLKKSHLEVCFDISTSVLVLLHLFMPRIKEPLKASVKSSLL